MWQAESKRARDDCHHVDDRESKEEALVDTLVRAARERAARDGLAGAVERPTEDDLGAYVAGTASPDQISAVQKVLAKSEALRCEVAERVAEIEDLSRPDIKHRFDRTKGWALPRPAGARDRGVGRSTGGASFWRLLRSPVFAFPFLLAAVLYPTYRWMAAERAVKRSEVIRDEASPPSNQPEATFPEELLVIPSQTLFIRGQTNFNLRGIEEVAVPVLTLDPVTRIVDVTVWAGLLDAESQCPIRRHNLGRAGHDDLEGGGLHWICERRR